MKVRPSASPIEFYQQQLAREARAAKAAERASEQSVGQARVVKREMGFRFGKFGMRLTSQDVEFDAAATAKERSRPETRRARAFADQLDVQRAYATQSGPPAAAPGRADAGSQGESRGPFTAMGRAIRAYVQQAAGFARDRLSSSLGSV